MNTDAIVQELVARIDATRRVLDLALQSPQSFASGDLVDVLRILTRPLPDA